MEHWFDYYKLQYDRVTQHENQRLLVSNFIIAISSAVFIFGIKLESTTHLYYLIILALILIILNILAIQFINKARYWIKFHQVRARRIMEHYDSSFQELIDEDKKIDSNKDKSRRPELQKGIHYILIILSLTYPFIIYNL